MNALNEATSDLIKDLMAVTPAAYHDAIAGEVLRWASNNFEELGVSHTISMDMEKHTKGDTDFKAHCIRQTACEFAIEILHKHGHGEEIVRRPWDRDDNRITYRKDYAPAWVENKNIPVKDLIVRAWVLKRKPTSWYDRETTKEFMEKLK